MENVSVDLLLLGHECPQRGQLSRYHEAGDGPQDFATFQAKAAYDEKTGTGDCVEWNFVQPEAARGVLGLWLLHAGKTESSGSQSREPFRSPGTTLSSLRIALPGPCLLEGHKRSEMRKDCRFGSCKSVKSASRLAWRAPDHAHLVSEWVQPDFNH